MNAWGGGERQGRVLVTLQFGLLAVLGLMAVRAVTLGAAVPLDAGLALAAGAALGVWALSANRPGNFRIRPTPHPRGKLVRHGPYRWLRHPMYSAVLLAAAAAARVAGLAEAGATAIEGPAALVWPAALPWLVWLGLLAVLIVKARVEERALRERFADYADYQRHSWRFVPGVY